MVNGTYLNIYFVTLFLQNVNFTNPFYAPPVLLTTVIDGGNNNANIACPAKGPLSSWLEVQSVRLKTTSNNSDGDYRDDNDEDEVNDHDNENENDNDNDYYYIWKITTITKLLIEHNFLIIDPKEGNHCRFIHTGLSQAFSHFIF